MASPIEHDAMSRAIAAAWESPRTLPNPRVGCVLIHPESNETIAVGVHRGPGSPHAEVEALTRAGATARGATAVVTMEPCHHTGRTCPCTMALINAGVARVVYGQADPNPRAQGGAAALAAAGIQTEGAVMAAAAAQLNVEWTYAIEAGRPHVTWKFAATLDGYSAAADGTSRWISGRQSRADAHRGRGESDVIMAGTGTIAVDDPHLTARPQGVTLSYDRQPTRVIVGKRDLSDDATVFDDAAPTLRIREHDPAMVLSLLAQREFCRVWLEGGPQLAGAFLRAGLIDRVIAYLAPAMLGAGRSALVTQAATLSDLHRLTIDDVSRTGDDIRLTGSFIRQPDDDRGT